MARDKLTVDVGGGHPFWDVYPSDKTYRKAGVKRDDMSSISVEIERDGSLRFNNGYEPGSDQYAAEKTLFDLTREVIVQALVEEIDARFPDEPHYAAFLEENLPSAGPRR